ncbi:MAG: tRNA epoxyqueuosine(34) reductase QueG [Bacteroidales bacterium]|nr:tRNA epoxyqueuosine(34) reductase QueG [Bacteroidales bacterium]MDZ4203414.1 tRNA epoxyqueuosine(34) reductase QueG [Bacteroidales bacterium]
MNKHYASSLIKEFAKNLGFQECGIAQAGALEDHREKLTNWLENGCHGEMHYMMNNVEKRLDPRRVVENARSVIAVLQNYYPQKSLSEDSPYLISRYAYGHDYHDVIKNKLRKLHQYINQQITPAAGRVFTDSAPVLERAWAIRAGLGWSGKNSMLLSRKNGSYFFIGELIIDLELEYDKPYSGNHCGNCRQCIDACPTKAISGNGIIDAKRCISYLTIEHTGSIPLEFEDTYSQWVFGCDICQQVCPWNRFSIPHLEPMFAMHDDIRSLGAVNWETLSEERFNELFSKSPLMRSKFKGVKKNVNFLKSSYNPAKSNPIS